MPDANLWLKTDTISFALAFCTVDKSNSNVGWIKSSEYLWNTILSRSLLGSIVNSFQVLPYSSVIFIIRSLPNCFLRILNKVFS